MIGIVEIVAQDAEAWDFKKCKKYALEHSALIQQAQITIEGSKLDLRQSKLALLPSLAVSTSYGLNLGRAIDPLTNDFTSDPTQFNSYGLSSSVVVFNGGKLRNAIKKTRWKLDSDKLALQKAKNELMIQLATAYIQALLANAQLTNAKKQLENAEAQLGRINKLIAVGQNRTSKQAAILEAEAQIANNELQILTAENQLISAKESVRRLLQLPYGTSFELSFPELKELDTIRPILTLREFTEQGLQDMPDVKIARLKAKSDELALREASGAYIPSISVGFSMGTGYSNRTVNLNDQGVLERTPFFEQLENNRNQGLSMGLSIPIFNNLQTRTTVEKARLNFEQSQIQTKEQETRFQQEVEKVHSDLVVALKTFQVNKKKLLSSTENFRVAQQKYELGQISVWDFRTARNTLESDQTSHIRAKYDYLVKRKIMDFYLGEEISFK
ncbi:MAG: TolC family protein [Flammeovirgaceae bacterium]